MAPWAPNYNGGPKMTRAEILAHMRAGLAEGGHCKAMFKNDPPEYLENEHRKDHTIWQGMLKHEHAMPVVLQAPHAI